MDFIQNISKFSALWNTSGWGKGGFVCIDISSCYQNLAARMLIFTFLSTLLKYMVVAALCRTSSQVSGYAAPDSRKRELTSRHIAGYAATGSSGCVQCTFLPRFWVRCSGLQMSDLVSCFLIPLWVRCTRLE